MPRKLADHSRLLLFYLKNLLPKNWRVIPLENVSENYLLKSLSCSITSISGVTPTSDIDFPDGK